MPCSIHCSRVLLGRNKDGVTKIRACTFVIHTHFGAAASEGAKVPEVAARVR